MLCDKCGNEAKANELATYGSCEDCSVESFLKWRSGSSCSVMREVAHPDGSYFVPASERAAPDECRQAKGG